MDIRQRMWKTIQLMDHMKLKRKEDQRVNVSVLFRRENNIIKRADFQTRKYDHLNLRDGFFNLTMSSVGIMQFFQGSPV